MTHEMLPILDLSPEIDELWDELNEAFQSVLKSKAFINGPQVQEFESQVAKYLGVPYAVGLNSGTDALFIGLQAMGVKPGDEVITSAFTFFATGEAISQCGARPVFVDIEPDTWNLNPSLVEAAITPKTKAIIPVHIFGHPVEMGPILELAKAKNLYVLEDMAQAFSAEWNGKKVGNLADGGAISFFPSKNLGGFGDGGMFVTNREEVAEKAKMLRAHGSRKKYYNEIIGYNSRLDTLQAALLSVKLPHIDKRTQGRREAATRYQELLADLPVQLPKERAGCQHAYHQFTVQLQAGHRDDLQTYLMDQGIQTMIYYPKPLHTMPPYKDYAVSLPLTEKACESVLSLPIWPTISAEQQMRVRDAMRGYFASLATTT